ncbi:MAG TPA: hypothetical protein VHF27_07015 [Acidimicrobiales bacterium]|nr:hypothetical protein [Acidimicrobiales bacterium]
MRGLLAVVMVTALLAGCRDGGEPGAPPAGTATTAPTGCPSLSPPGTTDATTAGGDFDGDGRPDRFLTYRVTPGGAWRVRAELAAGGGGEVELPATAEGVKAVGGVVLDVGPSQAGFAVVGRGGAGDTLGLFVLRSCRLERVTLSGRPAEFPVGTTATARAGLACQVPGLVAYEATSTDGRFYQARSVGYLLVGVILDEANRSTSTLGADDPDLTRYGTFSCGPLRL